MVTFIPLLLAAASVFEGGLQGVSVDVEVVKTSEICRLTSLRSSMMATDKHCLAGKSKEWPKTRKAARLRIKGEREKMR